MGLRRAALAAAVAVAGAAGVAAEETSGWREVDRKDGIVIESRPTAEGSVWMRGRTQLAHPVAALRAVLLDLPAFGQWAKGLARWEVLESGPDAALVYGRHDLPWPLADRDYVVRYTWEFAGRDGFRLEARAQEPAPVPPVEGVVRLRELHTVWEVEAAGPGRVRVAYTYRGDVGGVAETLARFTRSASLAGSFERLAARVAAVAEAGSP